MMKKLIFALFSKSSKYNLGILGKTCDLSKNLSGLGTFIILIFDFNN
jgi:hypothetical protein